MSQEDLFDINGLSVVMTGGTGVLGRAIVRSLVDHGADVALLSRDLDKARAQIKELDSTRGRCVAFQADVLDRKALASAARGVQKEFGRVDALINGAGGNDPKATTAPDVEFFDLNEEAWKVVSDVNFLGAVIPCQVFGKMMVEREQGIILNISSVSSLKPLTKVGAYSAAKGAINNFTQWLAVHMAQEYSPRIRVNAIAPGFFLTEQNRFLLTEGETGEWSARGKKVIEHTPMGRFGQPDDLVGAVLWLLSPASGFVTGIVIPVDGGFSAYSGV